LTRQSGKTEITTLNDSGISDRTRIAASRESSSSSPASSSFHQLLWIAQIWLVVVIVIAALLYVIWTDPGLIKEIYEIFETWV
jgi:hypothetical protein